MNKENGRNWEAEARETEEKKITVWRHRCQGQKYPSREKELAIVSNAWKKTIKINLSDLLNMKTLKNFLKAVFVEPVS